MLKQSVIYTGIDPSAKAFDVDRHYAGAPPIALVPSPRPNARLRLVCIPYAGGSATAYSRWAADLPDEVEVTTVELPGHGRLLREPLHRDIYPLIDHLAELLSSQSDKPYVVFGHSLGGLLAYCASLAMQSRGQPLAQHLVLSGCRPPHVPSKLEAVCRLSDADFHAHLRDRQSIPEALLTNRGFMALIMPIIRSDFELIVSYRQPPSNYRVKIPTSVFAGTHDPIAPQRELERWRDLIDGEIEMHHFEGHHFFIDQQRGMVTAALSAICLGALDEGT